MTRFGFAYPELAIREEGMPAMPVFMLIHVIYVIYVIYVLWWRRDIGL